MINTISEVEKSYLHGIIQLLEYSFLSLKIDIEISKTETLAITIYNVMEARWRKYHSIEHVFSMCDTSNAIQILAGILHDVIYLQIDRRVHPTLRQHLLEFSEIKDNIEASTNYEVTIPDTTSIKDGKDITLVNDVFGFKPGLKLTPMTGANEYLSAVVAARIFKSILSPWELIQVLACIEMTIPFRKPMENLTVPEQLEKRVTAIAKKYNLSVKKEDIQDTIKNAVECANRDVIGFSFENFPSFTSQTWQLILEGNPVFKNPMFTVSQYRAGLHKVEKFYSFLKPEIIYHEYKHPNFDNKRVRDMIDRAGQNLEMGREYFQAKLLTAAFLEAIAELTGGDAPIVLFIGQMSQRNVQKRTIMEDFLDLNIPERAGAKANSIIVKALDEMLYDAITHGLKKEITMSSYIYRRVDRDERIVLYGKAQNFFERKIPAQEYLASLNKDLREAMLNAVAELTTSRKQKILALKKTIAEYR